MIWFSAGRRVKARCSRRRTRPPGFRSPLQLPPRPGCKLPLAGSVPTAYPESMGEEIAAAKAMEVAEPAIAEPAIFPGESLHVLKHGDLFAVFNAWGDFHGLMHPVGPSTGADGLFQDDTRILSRLALSVAGKLPQLLGGTVG